MLNIFKHRALKLLPEKDIIDSLNDTPEQFFSEDTGMSDKQILECIASVPKSNIIETQDGKLALKQFDDYIELFKYTQPNICMLQELYPNQQIIKVKILCEKDKTIDMREYNSVKNTYNLLKEVGSTPDNDKELIELSRTKLIPTKDIVFIQRKLGPRAFPNSKTTMYTATSIICYNKHLILEITQ